MTLYFGAAFPSLCPLTALDRTDVFALKAGVQFAVKQPQLSTVAREWRLEPSRLDLRPGSDQLRSVRGLAGSLQASASSSIRWSEELYQPSKLVKRTEPTKFKGLPQCLAHCSAQEASGVATVSLSYSDH